jgi:hypothetical protein
MNIYEIQLREVGDRQPLSTHNVLAGDLEDAIEVVKKATAKQYKSIAVEVCGAREIARDVTFEPRRMRPAKG